MISFQTCLLYDEYQRTHSIVTALPLMATTTLAHPGCYLGLSPRCITNIVKYLIIRDVIFVPFSSAHEVKECHFYVEKEDFAG